MSLPDIYRSLFGKDQPQDGDVISLSEHGRVGGVSTGQGFKFTVPIDGASPTEGNNPSLTLGYTGDNLTTIDKTEGGSSVENIPGLEFSADNGTTPKTVSITKIPVLSIRPKSTFNSLDNRMTFIPQGLEVSTDNSIYYEIYYRPTLTSASWVSADSHSGVEYDVSATAFTGGVKIFSGYVSTSRNVDRGIQGVLGKLTLSPSRTGVSDILSIVAIRTSTNDGSVLCRLDWKELR